MYVRKVLEEKTQIGKGLEKSWLKKNASRNKASRKNTNMKKAGWEKRSGYKEKAGRGKVWLKKKYWKEEWIVHVNKG